VQSDRLSRVKPTPSEVGRIAVVTVVATAAGGLIAYLVALLLFGGDQQAAVRTLTILLPTLAVIGVTTQLAARRRGQAK